VGAADHLAVLLEEVRDEVERLALFGERERGGGGAERAALELAAAQLLDLGEQARRGLGGLAGGRQTPKQEAVLYRVGQVEGQHPPAGGAQTGAQVARVGLEGGEGGGAGVARHRGRAGEGLGGGEEQEERGHGKAQAAAKGHRRLLYGRNRVGRPGAVRLAGRRPSGATTRMVPPARISG
jgi:hypothetical protein